VKGCIAASPSGRWCPKIAHGGFRPPFNTSLLGHPCVHIPNSISIRSTILARLPFDQHTDIDDGTSYTLHLMQHNISSKHCCYYLCWQSEQYGHLEIKLQNWSTSFHNINYLKYLSSSIQLYTTTTQVIYRLTYEISWRYLWRWSSSFYMTNALPAVQLVVQNQYD